MKIIFLDIDGVLNYQGSEIIDKGCLSNLRYIVQSTGARIVLISTWKIFLNETVFNNLSAAEKIKFSYYRELISNVFKDDLEIMDIAEDYFADKNERVEDSILLSELEDPNHQGAWRSIEINRWIAKNGPVESFVIIDDFDCEYSKLYPNNWIGTYWFGKGLRKVDAEKAVGVLNRV